MDICMYVYNVSVCMIVRMYICVGMFICKYDVLVWINVCVCVCMSEYMYELMCVCMYIWICEWMYVCM
jgi:hypothetical protein